ncbi:beta-ribofuranosylaminobenzene 5'-phosphate synthase family protein [uncultured Pseudomonas sp.]|uniref:beta-ribofuranosylaminobenzene 5'-phosphate synthase family protein n=1 Tax=uncultured Pseudomonas sp. TaxID=114707 RepID=UPI0028047A06|nr:beta-ribofuranosylaminobenzene 5'-phosphate synthase family protein [uncultured Pseudomonas sp.]
MSKSIKISVPARLHVNLFDMSESGYRQNGGVGFCVNNFDTVINFRISHDFELVDRRVVGLTDLEANSLLEFLQRLYEDNNYSEKMTIEFLSGPPPHSGFGTGTASKLACAEAASIFNGIESSKAELIAASGRGGTSGVGINTYFHGGLSVDFGVKGSGAPLAPSSARKTSKIQPIQLLNIKLPSDWRFGVIISSDAHKISAEEEVNFFNKTCPIPLSSVYESVYHAVSGMACAALEADAVTFCTSINAIQQTQWKKAEWAAQSDEVDKLKTDLHGAGATCVGLSSLGPAIYFMAPDYEELVRKIRLLKSHIVVQCSPNNFGREIEID